MNLFFWMRVVAVVFLGLAAFKVPELPRVSWGWAGLLLIAITEIQP